MAEGSGPRVVCAGWGDHGRLGMVDESARSSFGVNEHLLELGITPHEVACGDRHSLVLTTRGAIYAFGDGDVGQLGQGDAQLVDEQPSERRRTAPVAVLAEGAADTSTLGFASHVAASDTSSFAINGKGQVYAWGDNRRGELGQGDRVARGIPTQVSAIADRRVKQVTCGAHHALALTGSGQVYSWGMGLMGQLGHKGLLGKPQAGGGDKLKPVMVEQLRGARVIHVAAGRYFSMCVASSKAKHILTDAFHEGHKTKETRVVLGWGSNEYGQLGTGDRKPRELPGINHEMMLVIKDKSKKGAGGGSKLVSRVFCGAFHTIMLLENSGLYVCGYNEYGQLGLGDVWDVLVPKPCKTVSNVVDVACGSRHTLLATGQGILYAAGFDHWGELGQGLEKIAMMFKAVKPLKGTRVMKCAAGPRHSMCIVDDDIDMGSAQFISAVKSDDLELQEAEEYGAGDKDSFKASSPASSRPSSPGAAKSAEGGDGKGADDASKDGPSSSSSSSHAAGGDASGGGGGGGGDTMEATPMRTCVRKSAADGFSLSCLGHPPVRSGKYRWNVQMDRLASEYVSAVGVSYMDVEPLYDPEHQGDGVTWLFLSNGHSLTSGYSEDYAVDWGWGDTIGIEVDYSIGTVRFFVNDRDQGVAFYETFDGRPLYLFIGITGEGDIMTVIPDEADDESKEDVYGEADDNMLCDNIALSSRRALPLQVFFTCRACGIKAMCRACAYVCHLGHCVELIVNHGELTCECGVAGGNKKTGAKCACLPEDMYAESNSSDEREEEELRALEAEVRNLRDESPTKGKGARMNNVISAARLQDAYK